MSCLPEILQRMLLVIDVSPFDLEYCVIIGLQTENERAGFVQVTFSFHTNCGGVSIFSLLKKC